MKRSRQGIALKRQERREWALTSLRNNLLLATDNLPAFGPELGSLSGTQAADVVVSHRIINKYQPPKDVDPAKRRIGSIEAALLNDVGWSDPGGLECVRMARARLSYWMAGFKPRYTFRAPTGASAEPSESDDLFVKLLNHKWEVSPDLLKYAATIAYRNHSLKRMVKVRFRAEYPYLEMCERFRALHGPNPFMCFLEQFRSVVTLNAVSRIETVPKDNDVDRMITCVPVWDMVCQLSFMLDLRSHMRARLGIDLRYLADLHKTLLPHDVATIDLSAASDRLSWSLVRAVWPAQLIKHLSKLRSSVASYRDQDGAEVFHHFRMFSPMGTGITFDVMTFTLLALLRGDRSASVFGDDIIVKRDYAEEAMSILESVGLVANRSKSFLSGKFRESCGGMYHDDIGYIKSYDIRYPHDIVDTINIVNKLDDIIAAKQVSYLVEGHLLNCVTELKGTLPRVVFADVEAPVGSTHVHARGAGRSTNVSSALGVNWNRVCRFHTAYVKTAESYSFDTGCAFAYGRFLYAGGSSPSKKVTIITSRTIETWSGASIQDASILPMVIC